MGRGGCEPPELAQEARQAAASRVAGGGGGLSSGPGGEAGLLKGALAPSPLSPPMSGLTHLQLFPSSAQHPLRPLGTGSCLPAAPCRLDLGIRPPPRPAVPGNHLSRCRLCLLQSVAAPRTPPWGEAGASAGRGDSHDRSWAANRETRSREPLVAQEAAASQTKKPQKNNR